MNKKISIISSPHNLQTENHRGRRLIAALWALAGARRGSPVSQKEMSNYLELSESCLSDWMSREAELKQIDALLRLLELAGEAAWLPELRRHLTVTPALGDAELAFNPVAVSRLRAILKEPVGLTFILGPDESARAWVFAALGHACAELAPQSGRVVAWIFCILIGSGQYLASSI